MTVVEQGWRKASVRYLKACFTGAGADRLLLLAADVLRSASLADAITVKRQSTPPRQPKAGQGMSPTPAAFSDCLAAGWPKDSPCSPLLVKALEERGAVAPATTPQR